MYNNRCTHPCAPTKTVLNFLRDGWAALPAAPEERRELLQEARYYQLPCLEAWLKAHCDNVSQQQHGAGVGVGATAGLTAIPPLPLPPAPLPLRFGSPPLSSPAAATAGTVASPFASYSSSPLSFGGHGGASASASGPMMMAMTMTSAGSSPAASPPPPMAPPPSLAGGGFAGGEPFGGAGAHASLSLLSVPAAAAMAMAAATATAAAGAPRPSVWEGAPSLTAADVAGGAYLRTSGAGGSFVSQWSRPAAPSIAAAGVRAGSLLSGAGAAAPPPVFAPPRASSASLLAAPSAGAAAAELTFAPAAVAGVAQPPAAQLLPPSPFPPSSTPEPSSAAAAAAAAPRWTAKYLAGNERLRAAVGALLELAYGCAPHPALREGRVAVTIAPADGCPHGRAGALLGIGSAAAPFPRVARVRGAAGWAFELALTTPGGGTPAAVLERFGALPEAVRDSWYVLVAVLRDEYGVALEEAEPLLAAVSAGRPACAACRRHCMSLVLERRA